MIAMAFFGGCADSCTLSQSDIVMPGLSAGSCGGIFSSGRASLINVRGAFSARYNADTLDNGHTVYTLPSLAFNVKGDGRYEVQTCFLSLQYPNASVSFAVSDYSIEIAKSGGTWVKAGAGDSMGSFSLNIHNFPNWLDGLISKFTYGIVKDAITDGVLLALNNEISLPTQSNGVLSTDEIPILSLSGFRAVVDSVVTTGSLPDFGQGDLANALYELSQKGILISIDSLEGVITVVKSKDQREETVRFLHAYRDENPGVIDELLSTYGLSWGDLVNSRDLTIPMD